ncbi:12069_t:CDS:1, partial [Rhizophagus irregularis]
MTQINKEVFEEAIEVNTKIYLNKFYDEFEEIYDKYIADIVNFKKVNEYLEYEEKTLGPNAYTKPGKTPICLNKRETKVPA